ncbi:MAG: hypothetical protein QT02_C0003G0041 [archaeon GW2011_AR9]|nr:MAG: hypothetical protein QT02_C0003G0041 [archaeon GW2011_AR9]MBS3120966.1 hypothetical protein [Candidatus Woesearchaeota archaeon]HIG93350.1 hypothetical protein [Candidatus Woesearchaeota archaeon]HIH13577.1 hypothetical protein [Candidatus Woesearchaeota archaeon]
MVNIDEFKQRIVQIVSQDYKIEFLGNNFDQIVYLLTENKAQKIYQFVQDVIARTIQPIVIGSEKTYKKWAAHELLTFRYPLSVNNTEYRILLVKVKNSIYIEFHLGDHKYYDKIRKDLDLKKSS